MEARRQASTTGIHPRRLTRRTALRGALGLAATVALSGATDRVTAQQSTPDSTIEQFYLGVATYQYKDAYALLGNELQAKQSLRAFIDGYADTAYVQVAISGNAASAGQQDVGVTITAWHNDGSIHAYSGTYTLDRVNGAWKIAGASITEGARPQNVAPLMRFADLDVTLGQPEAAVGHRYFHLLVTNNAQWTVTAAGVPHLKVLNASGGLVMDSSPGQLDPITAVTLRPGKTADAQFEWSNWCMAAPTHPLRLQIAIPGDTHELLIPFTTPMGEVEAPPCMGNASPAIFQSKAFQAAEQQ